MTSLNRSVGFSIFILFLFLPFNLYALSIDVPYEEEAGNHFKKGIFFIELPLYDYPFNTENRGSFPSMQQSLAITKDFYQLAHAGIENGLGSRRNLSTRLAIVALDILALPLGDTWLHEEWHRAVLSRRNTSSYNDVYNLDLLAEAISVSHIKDEDLIRLKRESPADMVRLAEAGIEGEYELVTALQKDNFFYGINTFNLPLYILTYAGAIDYVNFSGTGEAGVETDIFNLQEGSDVSKRDALGLDFTAWVYDLFRPTEPYEARGVHPSGVGIDRAIKPSDLTSEELSYLKRQGRLAYLNLLDPHLIGISRFRVTSEQSPQPTDFNISIRHYLTSFGYTIDTNVFFKKDNLNLFMIVHNYANGERHFPGLDVEILRYPLTRFKTPLTLNVRSAIWLQPEDQMFKTKAGKFGGLASLRAGWNGFKNVEPYMEVTAKTEGWVAGNAYLDSNTSVQTGLIYRFK